MFRSLLLEAIVLALISICLAGRDHQCSSHSANRNDLVINQDSPYTEQQRRLLLQIKPHPMKIYGYFINTGDDSSAVSSKTSTYIRTAFDIAASYFRRVLFLNDVNFATTFDSTGNCGAVQVPDVYRKFGFDDSIDLVVFVVAVSQSQQDFTARASACVRRRRPIYGQLTYNLFYFLNERSPFKAQNNVGITIHEMIHILGFSPSLFGNYYRSYLSNQRYNESDVTRQIDGRRFIVTPAVMAYVQHYFNCSDNITGALLAEDADTTSHWDSNVFLDEVMIPTTIASGLRVTYLTLLFLQDTGYYAYVNLAMSEPTVFGKNKGCDFARSQKNQKPEYCEVKGARNCGYYHQFYGSCLSARSYSTKQKIIWAHESNICLDPIIQETFPRSDSVFNPYPVFGDAARCIRTNASLPSCYEAQCINNTVVLHFNGMKKECSKPSEGIAMGSNFLFCPDDFQIFCSTRSCKNWCNFHGYCVNGSCICEPPYLPPYCEKVCVQGFYDQELSSCVSDCGPNKFKTANQVCLKVCPSGYKNNSQGVCVEYDSNYDTKSTNKRIVQTKLMNQYKLCIPMTLLLLFSFI